MNLVADEGVDFPVIRALREEGHEVLSILEEMPGSDDEEVLDLANKKEGILLTSDKDFGELVYRMKRAHFGVVLLRLEGISNKRKSEMLVKALQEHEEELPHAFTVIDPQAIRIRRG